MNVRLYMRARAREISWPRDAHAAACAPGKLAHAGDSPFLSERGVRLVPRKCHTKLFCISPSVLAVFNGLEQCKPLFLVLCARFRRHLDGPVALDLWTAHTHGYSGLKRGLVQPYRQGSPGREMVPLFV